MPEIITKSANPFLILLALSQKPSISLTDVDGLNVFPAQLEAHIDALAGAAVTLENLAEDMDTGEIDYYGDTDTMHREAEELHQLRHQLNQLMIFIRCPINSAKEADHDRN